MPYDLFAPSLGLLGFQQSSYINTQNKEQPCYELDEEKSTYIVAKMCPEFLLNLIREWKALKEAHDPLAIMGTMNSNQITLFARTAVELAKEVKQKEKALEQIEEQKPKVEFYDEVVDSTGYVDWNEAAKQLG
ncbi:Rha family transcriptional regulator, partial [Aeromonas media]